MINVNQITSQLARMPDQALQQYAQMHKSDPYVLSLALAESNRRKELRQGAQMNAPEQPKVADQAIQGMAAPMPEHVGIGQLPAGNMNFADGGIVAFGSGGDVPRYAGEDDQLVRSPFAFLNPGDIASSISRVFREGIDPEAARKRREALIAASAGAGSPAEQAAINAALSSAGTPTANLPTVRGAAPTAAAPTADTGSAGAKGPGQRVPPAGGPELLGGPGAGATASGPSMYSLASTPSTYQREFEQFLPQGKVADPFEADVRAQGAAEEKAAREYAARRKSQLEGMGLLGLDQEARLKTREEKLGKQESDLGPLALLQAGFAMMSGASPNALQNIGIGAQAGLKKYSEGTERLDAAREKIDDAFGRLEIARRNEKMLTDKELAEVDRDADKVVSQTKREVLNSARAAYGLSHAQAGKMFDAYVADKRLGAELGSRERMGFAQIQAQKDIAGGRNALMEKLYGGDVKARQEFGKLQQSVMKELSSNTAYSMEQDPTKKQAMYNQALQRAIQGNPFLAAYSAGIGFTKAPPPGKVLDLTE